MTKDQINNFEELKGWREPTEREQELIKPYMNHYTKVEIKSKYVGVAVCGVFACLFILFSLPANNAEDAFILVLGLICLVFAVWGYMGIVKSKQKLQKIERGSYDVLDCRCFSRDQDRYARIVTENGQHSKQAYRLFSYGYQMHDSTKWKEIPLLLMRCTMYLGTKEEQECNLFTYEYLEYCFEKECKKKHKQR